jgi:HSP20 family protein
MNSCYPLRSNSLNVNRLFSLADALLGERPQATATGWAPPVDVVETGAAYELHVDLPGVNAPEVKVIVRDNVLTLSGERTATPPVEGTKSHLTERPSGTFQRRFTLPKDADGERVSAAFKNGVLVISLPKREEVKPKEIEIKLS